MTVMLFVGGLFTALDSGQPAAVRIAGLAVASGAILIAAVVRVLTGRDVLDD